jgi:hypothetical protein
MIVSVFLFTLMLMLWIQLTSVEGFAPLWASEEKMDYSGNNISSLTGISLNNCKKKCMMDSKCKGIVTDYTGDGPGNCWLKSTLGTGVKEDSKNTYKLTRR